MESFFNNSFATLIAYIGIISTYLLVIPLLLFYWMNNRWNIMGKFERLGIYGLVFLFFPGLILFAPFLNLRLKGSCLLYTSPSPRDMPRSRMPSSA